MVASDFFSFSISPRVTFALCALSVYVLITCLEYSLVNVTLGCSFYICLFFRFVDFCQVNITKKNKVETAQWGLFLNKLLKQRFKVVVKFQFHFWTKYSTAAVTRKKPNIYNTNSEKAKTTVYSVYTVYTILYILCFICHKEISFFLKWIL